MYRIFLKKTDRCLRAAFYALLLCAVSAGIAKADEYHPYCVFKAVQPLEEGRAEAFDMTSCMKEHSAKPYVVVENGNVVYDFEEGTGFFAYNNISEDDEKAVLVTYLNAGGSGTFSAMAKLTKSTDKKGNLSVKPSTMFGGGDRCNGGIFSSKEADKKHLNIMTQITPATLYDLSGDLGMSERQREKNYLPSCSYCCAGEAVYSYDMDTGSVQLAKVTLDEKTAEDMFVVDNGDKLNCMFRMLEASKHAKNGTITGGNVKAFLKDFEKNCLDKN